MLKKYGIDKLAHKYALNIKQISKKSNEKIADFSNLNKNFYDEIEKNNIAIKKDTIKLNKIKFDSIKEFIYTNKGIPDTWKQRMNYKNELLNVIANDPNLLSYIGSIPSRASKIKSSESKFPRIKLKQNNSQLSMKELDEKIKIKEKNNSFSVNKEVLNKWNYKKKKEMEDKEISNILEDYKNAYPLDEKLNELKTFKKNLSKMNKRKNNVEEEHHNVNKSYQIINWKNNNNSMDIPKCNITSFIKKLLFFKKQKTLRQNIFNNLNSKEKCSSFSLDQIDINNNQENNILKRILNLNNKNKEKILSPFIQKNIDNINNYGPYYAYCPSCRAKNIEFYNNMDPDECVNLVNFIKRLRQKSDNKKIRKNISISSETRSILKRSVESKSNELTESMEKEKLDLV